MKKGLRPLFSAQYDLADRVTYTDNAGSVDMPQVQFYSYYDYEGNRVWLGDSQCGSVWYAWNNQRLQSMALYTGDTHLRFQDTWFFNFKGQQKKVLK